MHWNVREKENVCQVKVGYVSGLWSENERLFFEVIDEISALQSGLGEEVGLLLSE